MRTRTLAPLSKRRLLVSKARKRPSETVEKDNEPKKAQNLDDNSGTDGRIFVAGLTYERYQAQRREIDMVCHDHVPSRNIKASRSYRLLTIASKSWSWLYTRSISSQGLPV